VLHVARRSAVSVGLEFWSVGHRELLSVHEKGDRNVRRRPKIFKVAGVLGGYSMADTGEEREIRQRANAHQRETVTESKKRAQQVKGSLATGVPGKLRKRRGQRKLHK
jgi:hypothetical protein